MNYKHARIVVMFILSLLISFLFCFLFPQTATVRADEDVYINESNFPDHSFRDYVRSFDLDSNQRLDHSEIYAVTSIVCNKKGIKSLKGIEHFIYLGSLYCSGNELSVLDIGNNTRLEYLDCSRNELTSLDLSKNTKLSTLECQFNLLTTLDISGTEVTYLDCSHCCIYELHWCKSILQLYCNYNYLPKTPEMLPGDIESLYDFFYSPQLNGDVSIDDETFPDAAFRSYVSQLDNNPTDGILSAAERFSVKTLDCSRMNVNDLTGIKQFPFTQTLFCYGNQLKSLDLTENKQLKVLNCMGNKLTSLGVGSNKHLMNLICDHNQISGLDLNTNEELALLRCDENKLTKLNVKANKKLTKLYCKNNFLFALDLSTNTLLKEVDCSENFIQTSPQVPAGCALTFNPMKQVGIPQNLTVNQKTNTSVSLSWDAVKDATGYKVYRVNDIAYIELLKTSYTDVTINDLIPNKTYKYVVCAYISDGENSAYGVYSDICTVKTLANTPTPTLTPTVARPASPKNVKAESASDTSIKVSWSAVSGASGYQVWRATSGTSKFTSIGTVTETSKVSTGLTTGKMYYYKVRAYKEVNGTKYYGDYSNVVSAVTKPSAPTGVKAVSESATSVKVYWNAVNKAAGYQVWRATSAQGPFTSLGTVTGTSKVSVNLQTGTTYYYKVRAYVEVNGAKKYGDYSTVVSAVPKPSVPKGVKAISVSANSIQISWDAVSGATGYEVYRSTSENGTYSRLGSVTTTSRLCGSLTTGKTYYFKVRAYTEVKGIKVYSRFSSVVSAVPKV